MKKNKKTSPKRFWGVFLLSVCTLLILAFFIFILGFDVVKKGWSELRNSKIELKSGQEVSAEVISPTGPFYGYGSGV
ncbi:MAG TPA: hypothetical protein VK255_02775, partial [Patescibacteria group bacterium]|nr:hypothetical protein [Patescibacteria group bacterium]